MLIMMHDLPWIIIIILLPLTGAIFSFLLPHWVKPLGIIFALSIVIAVLGLGLQLLEQGAQRYEIGGWGAPLGIDLYADGLSLLLLMVTALSCLAISVYATGYFSRAYFKRSRAIYFWPLWMFLWAALNALFLSADIFNLYVTLELIGLSSVALIALAGGMDALTAAMRYLFVSLVGSLFYLLGVALLYHSFASLDIAILSQNTTSTPAVWVAMGLMSIGLLLKTALFPMHFWLPAAHVSAPTPVSALLSALVVKASFYILVRLWLEVFPISNAALGNLLALLGCMAILWGGIQALRQTRLKMLIAYSTVAQIGYLFLAFPLASVIAWKGVFFLLLSHAIAKTALFMAAGNILHFGGHDRIENFDHVVQHQPLTSVAFALAGVSIIGLPPSGGFVGKWLLLDAAIQSSQWWLVIIMVIGSLLAAAYIFKVIGYAFTKSRMLHQTRKVPLRMEWTALLLALMAIFLGLIAPWPLTVMDIGLPFSEAALQ
ncbi:MAG: oxidoreductase [Proteobacteria bacterium]|nr:oxidoreductase [Pseudomonadota bacterium]